MRLDAVRRGRVHRLARGDHCAGPGRDARGRGGGRSDWWGGDRQLEKKVAAFSIKSGAKTFVPLGHGTVADSAHGLHKIKVFATFLFTKTSLPSPAFKVSAAASRSTA